MSSMQVFSFPLSEELESPPPSKDHSGHIVYLALKGHTRLAADHILHKELRGHLEEVVGNAIRQLTLVFNKMRQEKSTEKSTVLCARVYDVLLNLGLNLFGLERRIVGFSEDEAERTLASVMQALKDLEGIERRGVLGGETAKAAIAKAVVDDLIAEMKKVMKGFYRPPGSMVAHAAEVIEKGLDEANIMVSFLTLARRQIQENIYYQMGEAGMCKFGNDYAIGLRWLRHLGFVQVSTNPSLAGIAYEDDTSQWEGFRDENLCPDFKTIVTRKPELLDSPLAHGDELVAYATEVSIWRNLTVFRPTAIASKMYHGMISLQLNPNIADSYKDSITYALKFYGDAEEFLKKYDEYLLWGYSETVERGRPNIVFKVAGSSPASIDITRKLESLGIGTNNTVTFTVAQEVELILAKMEGRADAAKKGIPLTTVYETNMGGRLDDHLREVQAEWLIEKALEKVGDKAKPLRRLAEELDAWYEVKEKTSIKEKVVAISSRKYTNPLTKEPIIDFLTESEIPSSVKDEVKGYLETLENDIQYCGILVTKRVYEIFFNPKNRPRWIEYLQSRYSLTREQAEEVMSGIDVLPASKRKTKETLLTLAGANMTHTEFPNHQRTIEMTSEEPGFNRKDYRESVLKSVDLEILSRLTEEWIGIRDLFIQAYETTPSQQEILRQAKIAGAEKYGVRGVKPEEWAAFGSTVKTMGEFSASYETFKRKCIEFAVKLLGKE